MKDVKSIKTAPKGCGEWFHDFSDNVDYKCGGFEGYLCEDCLPDCKKLNEQGSKK